MWTGLKMKILPLQVLKTQVLIRGFFLYFTILQYKLRSFNKPKGSGNYSDLDKTRVKLFPNFTPHHLITHTYSISFNSSNGGKFFWS